jgi:ubiquinone/menaquinone biosynthesis C-methylase UbiE
MERDSTGQPSLPDDPDKQRVAATYNAAADHFDDDPLGFWDRFGRGTVARLKVAPGARVLDVACGSGASALPAAEGVGPTGAVLGVDLADRLLTLARTKAAARGFSHVEFRRADMEQLGLPADSFDAVICVFGIFFASDMSNLVHALWRLVRPGGELAITTWGPGMFEPGSTYFWQAVQQERPDLYRGFNPWDRITEREALREMLRAGGVDEPRIELEVGTQALRSPEDFWTIALGSGYRGTIDQLDSAACERVRQATLAALRAHDVHEVETNAIAAIATKR